MSESQSSVRLMISSPLYRGATIALFLSGLGASAAAPQIASYLVNELGSSLRLAGLFYLTSLTAPIAGYLVGARSDRTGNRLGLFRWCALAGFIGWTLIALATELWMPFAISAVMLGVAGGAGSQLFAAIHDELKRHPTSVDDGIVSIVRMALTAGWVIGPVGGTLIADNFGHRAMFLLTALCLLGQIIPLGTMHLDVPARRADNGQNVGEKAIPGIGAMTPLLVFTALYILVYAGESIKYAYLPIYMTDSLDLSSSIKGAVIGVQPLVELALMPVAVIVSRRTGLLNLMVLAAGFGVTANIFFATSEGAFGLFMGQILMGGVWGVYAALGIIVAQRLLPTAVATASAIFMSSTALSSALGGLSGGFGVAALGLPSVFFVPASYGVMAILGLLLLIRWLPQRL